VSGITHPNVGIRDTLIGYRLTEGEISIVYQLYGKID
jgi:hypothetical protein